MNELNLVSIKDLFNHNWKKLEKLEEIPQQEGKYFGEHNKLRAYQDNTFGSNFRVIEFGSINITVVRNEVYKIEFKDKQATVNIYDWFNDLEGKINELEQEKNVPKELVVNGHTYKLVEEDQLPF